MHRIILLVVCLACTSHGHRVQTSSDDVDRQANPMQALATLLMAAEESAAFNPSGVPRHSVRTASLVPRAATLMEVKAPLADGVTLESFKTRTVDDVKTAFYKCYGMPIGAGEVNSFVSQILTSQSVAMVAKDWVYSRLYAFGMEELCNFFLDSLPKDEQKAKVKKCMLSSLGFDPEKIASEADALRTLAKEGEEKLLASEDFTDLAGRDSYKYTYPLGAGLLALIPLVDKEPTDDVIEKWAAKINLDPKKIKKDKAMYDMAVTKLAEVKEMMLQMQIGAKKREAQKLQEEAAKAEKEAAAAANASAPTPAPAPETPPPPGGRTGAI